MIEAVAVFNKILDEYGLPPFTKSTFTNPANQRLPGRTNEVMRDGAIIFRVDYATIYFTGSK